VKVKFVVIIKESGEILKMNNRTSRDNSIISQVCLKCAVEFAIKKDLDHESPEFEKHLNLLMDDFIEAYLHGVKRLEVDNG